LEAAPGEKTCVAGSGESRFVRCNFDCAVDREELVVGWQSVVAVLEQVPESECSHLV